MMAVGVLIALVHVFKWGDSCWLKAVYGRECILCGCTRDFMGVFGGRPIQNDYSVALMCILSGELVWRLVASIFRFGRKVMAVDAALHVLLAAVFLYFNFALIFGL